MARVVSINVGTPREVASGDTVVRTSIWKAPVSGRVAIRGVNVVGDDQSDRRVHGGERKAVYAYAAEDNAWWADRLGREIPPGTFGENLTLEGADVTGARVGERWRVGTALLEVTQPRMPCYKLELKMGLPGFIESFLDGGRPGAYFRIVEAGEVAAGDAATRVSRPADAPSMGEVMRAKRKAKAAEAG
jgi:MOSC domain-containing protein YiiM